MPTYRITITINATQQDPTRDVRGRVVSQRIAPIDSHYLTEAEDLQAAQSAAALLCGPRDAIRRIVQQATPEEGQIWTTGQRLYHILKIETRKGASQSDFQWEETSTGRKFWTLGGSFFDRLTYVCPDF